jgi:hypothetical protein
MRYSFYVTIEYDVLIARSGLRTGFWVLTLDGVLIFVAGDNEDLNWQNRKRSPGSYISTCEIPGNLLNAGTYMLNVAADIQGSEMLFLAKGVLKFHIEHTKVTVLDGANRSPGIICPSLRWQVSPAKINTEI